nr:hypothetical protein [Tanacetum cinerariifolium]
MSLFQSYEAAKESIMHFVLKSKVQGPSNLEANLGDLVYSGYRFVVLVGIWAGAMKLALQARNKYSFVDEFDALTKLPKCIYEVKCTCDASKELTMHQQLMKLMQFLRRLDDCYQPVMIALLTRDPLPEHNRFGHPDSQVLFALHGVIGYGLPSISLPSSLIATLVDVMSVGDKGVASISITMMSKEWKYQMQVE